MIEGSLSLEKPLQSAMGLRAECDFYKLLGGLFFLVIAVMKNPRSRKRARNRESLITETLG